MFHRVLAGHPGVRRGPWWRLGTHDLSKKTVSYWIQIIFVRECEAKVAKLWNFIFKRSWNPGCLHEISCPLIHIFKNKVQAKENMFVG